MGCQVTEKKKKSTPDSFSTVEEQKDWRNELETLEYGSVLSEDMKMHLRPYLEKSIENVNLYRFDYKKQTWWIQVNTESSENKVTEIAKR